MNSLLKFLIILVIFVLNTAFAELVDRHIQLKEIDRKPAHNLPHENNKTYIYQWVPGSNGSLIQKRCEWSDKQERAFNCVELKKPNFLKKPS